MTHVAFATIGNGDLRFKLDGAWIAPVDWNIPECQALITREFRLEATDPKRVPSRLLSQVLGELIGAAIDINDIRLPMVAPFVKTAVAEAGAIDTLFLLTTNQPASREDDTCELGTLIGRVLASGYPIGTVKTLEATIDPTDLENALAEVSRLLSSPEVETAIAGGVRRISILSTGGPPKLREALRHRAVLTYGYTICALYDASFPRDSTGKPIPQSGEDSPIQPYDPFPVLRDFAFESMRHMIDEHDYHSARSLFTRYMKYQGTGLLHAVLAHAAFRQEHQYQDAHRAIQPFVSLGEPYRSWYLDMSQAIGGDSRQGSARAALLRRIHELYWAAGTRYRSEHVVDFLGRVTAFQELVCRAAIAEIAQEDVLWSAFLISDERPQPVPPYFRIDQISDSGLRKTLEARKPTPEARSGRNTSRGIDRDLPGQYFDSKATLAENGGNPSRSIDRALWLNLLEATTATHDRKEELLRWLGALRPIADARNESLHTGRTLSLVDLNSRLAGRTDGRCPCRRASDNKHPIAVHIMDKIVEVLDIVTKETRFADPYPVISETLQDLMAQRSNQL